MNPPFQSFLRRFYRTPKGEVLLSQEKALVAHSLAQVFGLYLVQLGVHCDTSLLETSRVNYKVLVDQDQPFKSEQNAVRADIDYLPFKRDSIDVVVMPHTLEAVKDPYHLVRQADEMLVPEGHILISGFNPMGCKVWMSRWGAHRQEFKQANIIRAHRVIDWLQLLGYDIKEVSYGSASCLSKQAEPRWKIVRWFYKALARCGIHFGNVYCILAKKRVSSPTPVGLNWQISNWLPVRKGRSVVSSNREKIGVKE